MASQSFCWKHACLSPPHCHHATSTATDESTIFLCRWELEKTHDALLCLCKGDVPATGKCSSILRTGWFTVYVARHKLCHLCCLNLHHDTPSTHLYAYRIMFFLLILFKVAITSPDPDFNTDAKEYFTRHMRILERCVSSRAMPETKAQIDALREAFSADTSKPFELKPNFPYRSPSPNMRPSPSFDIKYQHDVLSRSNSNGQIAQVPYHHQPLTPPMSGEHELPNQPISARSMPIMPTIEHQPISLTSNSIDNDTIAWNPSRIFEYDLEKDKVKSSTNKVNSQWNTAFGTSNDLVSTRTVPVPQPSPPLYTSSAIRSHEQTPLHDAMQRPTQQQYSVQSSIAPIPAMPEAPAVMSQPSYTSPSPSFVTSSMWRDTVANTYDPGGHKRRWEVETNFLVDLTQPKGLK